MDNDELYKAAVHEYYKIYNALRKKYNLRERGHFDAHSGHIEVWQYKNERPERCVCNVRAAGETAAYKLAVEDLKFFEKNEKEREEHAKRAG